LIEEHKCSGKPGATKKVMLKVSLNALKSGKKSNPNLADLDF
jgi:hypothetical protein